MTGRAEDFYAAPWTDLRRNRTDADLTDVKFLAAEADHTLTRTTTPSAIRCVEQSGPHEAHGDIGR